MYNNVLISLAVSGLPILAFAFIGLLLLQKLYVKIRSNFAATVNCWFCNQNTCVPYLESNSWTCPQCEQYNGFTKDGDYNRDMFQQFDCSNTSVGFARQDQSSTDHDRSVSALSAIKNNGLCFECNEAQRLKVEKLAQFEPKNESCFDEELQKYKVKLEEQYRLCSSCDRHVRKVLHEKKKMVLGSKFLDFIIKGAETLKQPHFNHFRHVQREHWKRRFSLHITILTIINLICLCYMLPTLKREQITAVLGDRVGEQLFMAMSHVLALCRVLTAYISQIGAYPLIEKCKLFTRTIFMMLLYSLGLRLPQITRIDFSSLYVLAYPFALLGISFGYKLIDGFKLTRFTFLLALWSTFAGGLIEEQLYFSTNVLLLFASVLTLLLSMTNEVEISPKLHNSSANSFHKIYSEDYLSDDDTISMLSQHFNCSTASTVRSTSIRAGEGTSLQNSRLYKSPVTSSTYSLNNMPPRTQFSPNSSFKSCYFDGPANSNAMLSEYASSIAGDFNTNTAATQLTKRAPFFGSNLELNSSHHHQRPRSTMFDETGNHNGNVSANASLLRSSFNGETNNNQHLQHNATFAHYQAGTSSSLNRKQFSAHTSTLHSPFSLSSNAVYQQQQQTLQRPASTTNLLTPSRLSTNGFVSNVYPASTANTVSWLAVGALNHTNKHFPELRQPMMSTIGENRSRASSQSSGFESQNDRLNVSRENSFNTANENLDTSVQQANATTPRAFQPIHEANSSRLSYTPRQSLLSHNAELVTPLSVNCGMASPLAGPALSDLWAAPAQRRSTSSRDSFNLRKINEELPVPGFTKYKRGDLLKKWKESQMIS